MACSTTPEDVLALTAPTATFLCPLSANTYAIDFLSFKIVDDTSKRVIFEVHKDPDAPPLESLVGINEALIRTIKYDFPTDVIRLPNISTRSEKYLIILTSR